MLAILAETALNNLTNRLRKRVAVVICHLLDQIDDLAELTVACLSQVADLILGLLYVC